jgi:DNA-binding NtrC family response regulator
VARHLLKAGAFDYLRKPPDFPHLFAVVALAVAAGREKSRPGTVVPLMSDRRTHPGESAADATPSAADGDDLLRRPYRL